MKIAVSADDRNSIHKGHFGDAPQYLIYRFKNGTLTFEEERKNPLFDKDSVTHGKVRQIVQNLQDCDVLLGRGFGKQSLIKLNEFNKVAWLVRFNSIDRFEDAMTKKETSAIHRFSPQLEKFQPLRAEDLG